MPACHGMELADKRWLTPAARPAGEFGHADMLVPLTVRPAVMDAHFQGRLVKMANARQDFRFQCPENYSM